jgi:hypothetical protein
MQCICKLKTNYELVNAASDIHSCLDIVFSAERVVNRRQIVSAFGDGFWVAEGSVALLEMSFLSQVAHLFNVSFCLQI